MSKRIVITGATGFVGRALCHRLIQDGYEIIALTRQLNNAALPAVENLKATHWDGATVGDWSQYVDGAYAVINLAGENIAGLWTRRKKQTILQSRIDATNAVCRVIAQAIKKPQVLVQISGIGYYGSRGDEILDENASAGDGFLADVCKQWEQAAQPVAEQGVRLVILRLAAVLGREGGFLKRVLPAFRAFAGGCPGSGDQWLAWVHIDDVVAAIQFVLENNNCQGIYNLTASEPLTARDFYRTLGKIIHRPSFLPLPGWALRIFMGQMAEELLLASQRALPTRLLQTGYVFRYRQARDALENLLSQ